MSDEDHDFVARVRWSILFKVQDSESWIFDEEFDSQSTAVSSPVIRGHDGADSEALTFNV